MGCGSGVSTAAGGADAGFGWRWQYRGRGWRWKAEVFSAVARRWRQRVLAGATDGTEFPALRITSTP